jgi:tetratricopeptide (TPR) repeat protein
LGAADSLSGRPTGGARPTLRSVQRRAPSTSGGSRVPNERAPRARPAPSAEGRRPAEPRSLREALAAADRGRLDLALEITAEALARDPLDADAYYVRGLTQLACDDPRAAVASLRRAVYIDTQFSAALFKLARAHDALGSIDAARQVYERTLRSLTRDAEAPRELVHNVEVTDIAVACHARLNALRAPHRSSAKSAA